MKKFGIEIRRVKNQSVGQLFDTVNATLNKYGIPSKSINANNQIDAAAHAIQKMIRVDGFFDVTTVKTIAQLCNTYISSERIAFYRTIHCVDWSDMTEEFREQVIAMVLDDFREVLNYQNHNYEE